jgi:outer membrane protein assembly factor BamE (lipoprotein component of BamABCDE complex)
MKLKILFAMVLVCVLAGGCATVGHDFTRPPDGSLVIGKTTYAQAIALLGPPYREGTGLRNGRITNQLHYFYSNKGGNSLVPNTLPSRELLLVFSNNALVAYRYRSSYEGDDTDFDESKVGEIVEGKTRKDRVIKLLGQPSGVGVFPMVADRNGSLLAYIYSHSKPGSGAPYFKYLDITLDKDGIVTKVDFLTSGDK